MKKEKILHAARAAFPHTLPIFAGFLFVGFAFGIYIKSMGFPTYCPILMSIFIFAGSGQFVAGSFLLQPFAPLSSFFTTVLVNARHVFYGLSMLNEYHDIGKKRLPIIFWMCDETFSVNCTAVIPENIDKGWFYFFVSLFDYLYWQLGTILGAVCGDILPFDTTGIDFVMTALFIVIFVNQWDREKNHTSSLVGFGFSLLCLVIFGAKNFLLPSMIGIFICLTLLRNRLEKGGIQ